MKSLPDPSAYDQQYETPTLHPKLEYTCHIWDNCSDKNSDILDNFQLA